MISLYTAPSFEDLPSISPPSLELETWFRMAKLPYEKVIVKAQSFEIAPKGKIPFIDYQGKLIGDAFLIIEMFKQTEGIDLDASLTPVERSLSLAFRRMLKENTLWGAAEVRFGIEENWQHYRVIVARALFPETPLEISEPFADEFRKTIISQMHSHGIGRHSHKEISQIICADFQALSDFLADKPFFMGDEPTTLDATAYGYIGNFLQPRYESPIVDYLLGRSNLCQHYERMSHKFFSDSLLEL
ncbi:glutathione S-transferase family protein [Nostoc sp. FACHB-133]|uniref:glutathione S-transferase family protein n=1 Tax=Nostoc sp. FACHB-133 TaxID=2692835 RepID=UPI0016850223|nr:glutathione S-transferase family protein [Nostoc sp. FACHB-133]MBD2527803.1 glutathione S-transferase family protein [Nostoc sp. FACHB-133]